MLRISDNGRFLVHEDSRPFFYLGDTAWELFHRLNREEAEHYLQTRAAQGFTVIQAVALAEFDGLRAPNAYGDVPFYDFDPTRPVEAYWQHVDFIVNTAQASGLFVGLLPTWGDKWHQGHNLPYAGPEIFTPDNAFAYGEWLGRRYRDAAIIWILGADRAVKIEPHRAIIRAMAAGIKAGNGGRHLMTFHPNGGSSSADYFHKDNWLDFNMLQSGHVGRDNANYDAVARDYAGTPVKPCMDGEPRYEDHPVMSPDWSWDGRDWFDDYDMRKACYTALFAGAHGHTYGCHDIWQMWDPKHPVVNNVRTPWREALHLPGANQMRHARTLMESRPFLSRIPDQNLILSDVGSGSHRVQATRDTDGSYAFVYIASGQPVTVDLGKLSGRRTTMWWFDPRNGQAIDIGVDENGGQREFVPPSSGPSCDWVLVLDDAERRFAAINHLGGV